MVRRRNTFALAEALHKFAWEVEALPYTEFAEWLGHFELQAREQKEREANAKKPKGNQIPKKERERLEREAAERGEHQRIELPEG